MVDESRNLVIGVANIAFAAKEVVVATRKIISAAREVESTRARRPVRENQRR